jgi:hypothetical protein
VSATARQAEVLATLVAALPSALGAAVVVEAQAVSPALWRATAMPIVRPKHGVRLLPNRIYVLEPRTRLEITLDGTLIGASRGRSRPIERLMCALAT